MTVTAIAFERCWRMLPDLLLRRAGFPLSLLTDVTDPALVDADEDLVSTIAEWERLRTTVLRDVLPAVVQDARSDPEPERSRQRLRALSRWRSALGRRIVRPAPETSLAELAAQLAQADREVSRAAARVAELGGEHQEGKHILDALSDPRVRLALVQLSPSFEKHIDHLRGRNLERGYLFLQRLAAKNETMSFFGPIVHARVDSEIHGLQIRHSDPNGIRTREAFLSFWATRVLADTIGQDPAIAGDVPVRRNPLVALTESGVRLPDGREVRLSPADRLLVETDGRCVRDVPERLMRARILVPGLEPPSTRLRPLDELRDLVQRIAPDSGWNTSLDELSRLVHEYGQTTEATERIAALERLEARFTELTEAPARRRPGETYADRHVVYEECQGDDVFVVGADVAARWTKHLAPYLDWCATYGAERQKAMRALASEMLAEHGGKLDLLAFADRLATAVGEGRLEPLLDGVRALEARWRDLVAAHTTDGVARLDLPENPASPAFVSPDLLLGKDFLVVGELHPYVFAWGSQRLFGPETYKIDLEPWGGPERIATILRRRVHKGLLGDAFPGRFAEVTGIASHKTRCLAVADLWVEAGHDGPCLYSPDGPLVLYTGEEDHPHLLALSAIPVVAPRCRFGDSAPRVRVGDLVVQRARWWPSRDQLDEIVGARHASERLRLVCRLRGELGIPRWVFVKSSTEVKPVCLDLCSAVASGVLAKLAAGADLLVEEMLPAPGSMWLHRDGREFTSELRLALVRTDGAG
jgi:hypothetical protein